MLKQNISLTVIRKVWWPHARKLWGETKEPVSLTYPLTEF